MFQLLKIFCNEELFSLYGMAVSSPKKYAESVSAISIGQRPMGKKVFSPTASPERVKADIVTPFQGLRLLSLLNVGRCPTLFSFAPLGQYYRRT